MCFSASASFAAAAVLVPAGIWTLGRAWNGDRRLLGLATFPLLFGVQQVSEGMLWRALDRGDVAGQQGPALAFLFFAYFVWPFLVPLAAMLAEHDPGRRRLLAWLSAAGLALGLSLLVPLLIHADWMALRLERASILYEPRLIWDGLVGHTPIRVVYAGIICGALLLSTDRDVRIFGGLITASVVLGFLFAAYAFVSIWCFFAALISLWIVVVMRRRQVPLVA